MTAYESPRDAEGNRLCEYCGDPVPESLGTKPKRYCKRSCRQRAYEARKNREAIVTAVAVAVAHDRRTSRVVDRSDRVTTRDVANPQAAAEVPAQAADSRPAVPPPVPPAPGRSRRRPGMQAEAMPLWPSEEYGGEPTAQP